jgi:hypothetical protein
VKIIKNTLLVLSTGYIFVYFSEHLFWARMRPDDTLGGWVTSWIAYSLTAFLFLTLVEHFTIRNIWPLFLAGATFGWLIEGVIVQTTYESLPLSISFTGLAWHALITVWIGWYAIRRSLISTDSFATLKLSSVIGVCYGLWAISWWLEPDGGVSSLAEFAKFSLVTTTLVIIAYWLANWSASEPFRPQRWVTLVIPSIFVLYFLVAAVPAIPVALAILPILLGLVFLGLRRNRVIDADDSFIRKLSGPVPVVKYFSLLAVPLVAILIYFIALAVNLQWQTNWILYLVTTPLGFILFGVSLYKSWQRPVTS